MSKQKLSMRMKSFYARDVKTALALARQELGPEAMLVDSRRSPPESRHLGDCEVVVAVVPGTPAQAAAPEPQHSYSNLAVEVAELRKQMERMAVSVTRSTLVASAHTLPDPELMSAFGALIESDLDPELAHAILNRVRAEGVPATPDRLRLAVAAELAGRFTCEPQLGTGAAGPRIVALVGPCGAGKTTALVKLAARYGFSTRRPTHVLCADTMRIAASEQLRTCAAILGVGFQVAESPRALEQALEELRHKDLILIDTPGYGPDDMDGSEELAAVLSSHREIDTHLVLTASMRSADLSRVVDRFEVFRPGKLLFTRLDETASFGPLVNEAVRTGKAVSFLAAGQRIPEDLEPAAKERIIELVLAPGGRA